MPDQPLRSEATQDADAVGSVDRFQVVFGDKPLQGWREFLEHLHELPGILAVLRPTSEGIFDTTKEVQGPGEQSPFRLREQHLVSSDSLHPPKTGPLWRGLLRFFRSDGVGFSHVPCMGWRPNPMKTRLSILAALLTLTGACADEGASEDRVAHIFVATECEGTATLTVTSQLDQENPVVVEEDCDAGGVEAEVDLAGVWQVVVNYEVGAVNCIVEVPQTAIDAGDTIVACE